MSAGSVMWAYLTSSIIKPEWDMSYLIHDCNDEVESSRIG
jgi:hypothetical protein